MEEETKLKLRRLVEARSRKLDRLKFRGDTKAFGRQKRLLRQAQRLGILSEDEAVALASASLPMLLHAAQIAWGERAEEKVGECCERVLDEANRQYVERN